MDDEPRLMPKAEVLGILRRLGTPAETMRALEDGLDDPVDLDREARLLAEYGINRGQLMDDWGGSP
jgi:hypothetical protein